MVSYWNLSYPERENTKETIDFLREQADQLGKLTDGAVLAKFIKNRACSDGEMASISLSKLYSKKLYEFFITDASKIYELHIFGLFCNEEYPVTLLIDEEIAKEAGLDEKIDIKSFSDFKNIFKRVLSTNKVCYVIRRLRQMESKRSIQA